MPIAKELRKFYGAQWRQNVRPRILERAGGRCEQCNKGPDRKRLVVVRDGSGRWLDKGLIWRGPDGDRAEDPPRRTRRYRIHLVLTVAHLNHTPGDDRDENLKALCQRCHLVHDRQQHRETLLRRIEERSGQRRLW